MNDEHTLPHTNTNTVIPVHTHIYSFAFHTAFIPSAPTQPYPLKALLIYYTFAIVSSFFPPFPRLLAPLVTGGEIYVGPLGVKVQLAVAGLVNIPYLSTPDTSTAPFISNHTCC